MDDNLVGQQIGHYRIDTMLGRGGMGAVYRAYDTNLARPVALKVMHGHLADQGRFKQRFMQEAQTIARLDHPSIVNIFDFGQKEDMLYMVMTYLEGGNLADYIKELKRQEKSVKLDEILFLLSQVADALGYAHAQGVLHRDVKPDNIMIKRLRRPERTGEPPLRAVVTDFGLAKLLKGGMHTATGTLLGTMDYISPEQCRGEQPGPGSDIYALGVMVYHLTTGRLPFHITSLTDAIIKHTRETPPSPCEIRPEIPPPLEVVISKAMAKNPEDRYQNAEEMASLLRRIRETLTAEEIAHYTRNTMVLSLIEQMRDEEGLTPAMQTRPYAPPTTVEKGGQTAQPAQVSMVLRPTLLQVVPGGRVMANINLVNSGQSAVPIRLQIEDLPQEWVNYRQDVFQLLPGSQQSLPIVIKPSSDDSATAGQHPFRVLVISEEDDQELAGIGGIVQIPIIEQFASELRPAQVKSGETAQLFVRNDGNTATTFQVGGEDPENIVRFESVSNNLQNVDPGQVGTMDLRVSANKRPLFGRARVKPFRLQINGQSNYQQLSGQIEIKPRIPIALLVLVVLLVCVGGVAGAFALISNGVFETADVGATSTAQAVALIQTEEAAETEVTEEPTPDPQQTAIAMRTIEAEGTIMAITAEADGDDDNDGLSNLVERALGTSPDVSDTDGDGLLDGEEINQYNSDPSEVDTDGDGLTDGEEIRIYRTSVNNPDTDGDNVQDGDEVEEGTDPLAQATSTPTVTPTPSPTSTATPTPTPTETPTRQNTAAGTGGGLPLGFESFGVWGRGDQANGTITQSGEQAYSGGSSAKISYDFSTPDNDFVVFLQFNNIPGEPTGLSVWVYGDGEGHYLNAWIIDSEGQTWQMPFGRVTHTGWAQMSGMIDTDQDWPWTHISGPDNETVDYPIRFRGFALDDVNNAYVGQGEIYLDDLTAIP